MLFAQLEQQIVSQVTALVAHKRTLASWKDRRLWQDVQVNRLSFMRKVALLTDPAQATYARMDTLYHDFRCSIAHGNIAAVGPILIPAVAIELRALARVLRA